jgi:putative membrane protein
MSNRRGPIIPFATIGVLSMAAACGPQPGGGGDTANTESIVKTEPAKAPSDRGDRVATGGDLAFMNDAAAGGMAEIELGRLAVKQAASKEVKQFAERVIADHSKAGEELKQLAQRKQVMLPQEVNPKHRETIDKLSPQRGAAFDRAYVKAMVANQVKDVTGFESVAKGAVDADVKDYAAKILPTLKAHLQTIRGIAAKMGNQTES